VKVIESAVAIELAQLFAIVVDPIRVVVIAVREKSVPLGFLGHDHIAQIAVRELLVADHVDIEDPALGPFIDHEDQVDALLRQFDDLRSDRCADATGPSVELNDPLNVRLRARAGENAARPHLHLVAQLVFLEFVVSLEHHLIDDRVFRHTHDQIRALQLDLHIGEKIGFE